MYVASGVASCTVFQIVPTKSQSNSFFIKSRRKKSCAAVENEPYEFTKFYHTINRNEKINNNASFPVIVSVRHIVIKNKITNKKYSLQSFVHFALLLLTICICICSCSYLTDWIDLKSTTNDYSRTDSRQV